MKRTLFSVVALFGLFALTSSATQVTYSTSGVFGSTGLSSDDFFNFYGTDGEVGEPFPTGANFGAFTASGNAGTLADTFTLTVDQSMPSTGMNTLDSTLTGSIYTDSSNVVLSFAGDGPVLHQNGHDYITFAIGDVNYAVEEYTMLTPSSTTFGLTSLNGLIVGTPEPSSWALGGMGVAGILAGALRRRKQVAQTAR